MPEPSESSSVRLSAIYESPSGRKDFAYAVSTPQAGHDGSIKTDAKSKYLSELRASTKKLQEDVNKFLTEKMEEDKRAAGQHGLNGASKEKFTDELEEEKYGEENAEEET
ncbi:hypothetical protein H2200_006393 [Cladophialophora chaetospira]|uniref:EKC/KEOPS complex subunit GON7 n=1 Tax=Cladophialophora chaetospira TaxID=386627 RepID=A0AA39CH74_9EURO|nr:hypothetical protein H2200_006393 [Cladophialophora chaetospira]